jgi:hypothetical protein
MRNVCEPHTSNLAFGRCNHTGVCSICFARMRGVLRDSACPICKADLDVVLCSASVTDFRAIEIWGQDAGPEYSFDEKTKMFFPKKYYREQVSSNIDEANHLFLHLLVCSFHSLMSQITSLWTPRCSLCGQTRRDPESLRKHIMNEHNMMMCLLCIENLHCFPSEFKVYKSVDYERHVRFGDDQGSEGHPSCEFCKKRYFDKTALFIHLHKDHFTCHICEKDGIYYKYYDNYSCLENHFRREHCLCEEPSCLEKKFVVFTNEIDLASHKRQWHPHLQV